MFTIGYMTNQKYNFSTNTAYRHKTYEGGDMLQGAPTHKFIWSLNEVVMWGLVTIKYICLYLQKTSVHQTRKGAGLQWEFLILKAICFSNHMTNMRYNLENFLFPFSQGLPLHKKWSFPWRISSVNVTKSAVSCGFGQIYWSNP